MTRDPDANGWQMDGLEMDGLEMTGLELNGLEIRAATPYDAPLVAALHGACFCSRESLDSDGPRNENGPWNESAMAQFIAGPGTVCLIAAIAGNEPIGFLIVRAAADEAELLTIGVLPDHRKRGAGQALLREAAGRLRPGGARRLFLEVEETNGPALALYRGLGAVPVGRRPRYYENGADAAVLCLDLQARP